MAIACLEDSRRSEAATVRGLVATQSASAGQSALMALQGALSEQGDTGLAALLQARCAGCFDRVVVDPVGSSTGTGVLSSNAGSDSGAADSGGNASFLLPLLLVGILLCCMCLCCGLMAAFLYKKKQAPEFNELDDTSVQPSTRGDASRSSVEHGVGGLVPGTGSISTLDGGAGSYPAPQRDSDDVVDSDDVGDSYEGPTTFGIASSSSAFSMKNKAVTCE